MCILSTRFVSKSSRYEDERAAVGMRTGSYLQQLSRPLQCHFALYCEAPADHFNIPALIVTGDNPGQKLKLPAITEQQMEEHNRTFPLRGFLFFACRCELFFRHVFHHNPARLAHWT
ncbi:hypothetical protein CHARACLAT_002680 [Characodon lateralis]|uniref:Uncharacterized protein n=1 Tax=Characodon lateralis TaxID=208331 RepID=A0ABU7DND5_9TELE|nr:hypothetical protein [Characodon lateralis]